MLLLLLPLCVPTVFRLELLFLLESVPDGGRPELCPFFPNDGEWIGLRSAKTLARNMF